MTNKVIVLDWGIFIHKAIFAYPMNPSIPPTYNCLNMMISSMYRLGLEPDDIVIVAVDGRNSWRKDFETQYKGDRKEKRQASGIDFDHWYEEFNKLHTRLDAGLDWHFIKVDRLEADDVMAVCCRFYLDREVILVTHDADLQQCWIYPNVKIFSTMSKKQGGGKFKLRPDNFDLTHFHASKIHKETTDNMVAPVMTDEEYFNRKMCVDLTVLPPWVENAVLDKLKLVGPKACDLNAIPFPTLRPKFEEIYNDTSKVIKYEEQLAKEVAEEARIKARKQEAKDKLKRAEQRLEKKYQKEVKVQTSKLEAKIKKLEKQNISKTTKEKVNEIHSDNTTNKSEAHGEA